MTKEEKLLASRLMKLAADEFGNHGCNDMDMTMFNGIAPDARQQMLTDFNIYNRTEAIDVRPIEYVYDSSWMSYLAHRLREEST